MIDHELSTVQATGASHVQLQQVKGRWIRSWQPADWSVGDEIAVSSTEYDSTQAETFKIVSVSGNVLSLDHPAAFSHFAATIDTAAATNPTAPQSVRLAAAVGLLTRTITLTSEITDDEPRYGSHVVVTEILSEPEGSASSFVGSLVANGVDFRRMGQGEMEAAAVKFTYFPPRPAPHSQPTRR